jgi:hypothetical protein
MIRRSEVALEKVGDARQLAARRAAEDSSGCGDFTVVPATVPA